MGSKLSWRWAILLPLPFLWPNLAGERQLIQTGWDSPTAAEFRSGLAEFERWNLFDGAAVAPTRRIGDKSVVCSPAFLTNRWEWSEFGDCVRDLQAAHPQRCTNNFLMLLAKPGNVGWFDDAGWSEVANHWRLLARVAREGRMAGIIFDPEPYSKPWAQFLYAAQPDKDQHSFAEMSAKARERGRAVMAAIGEECPNMTLLAYRLFSDLPYSGEPSRPVINIESSPYGLLPAFVNGWCDALRPGISIVDGNEFAYGYESEQEYALTFTRLKLEAPRFVSPENRAKFRAQFGVGHGFYLDGYTPAAGGKPRYDFKERSALNRLTAFTAAALDAADGPVWIYGEGGRWWPGPTNRATWPEKFPGVEAALRAAKDPIGFATEYLRDVKTEANRLRDGNFGEGAGGRNAWFSWQAATSKGKTKQGDKAALLAGMENGSLSQAVPVKPGEIYAVGARVKSSGAGDVGLSIGWQKEGGRWVATSQRVEFGASTPPDAEGWRQIAGLVHVPADATNLGFVLFARKQEATSEVMFRDPVVARVDK